MRGGSLSLPRFFSFCKYIPNSFQYPRIQQRRSNRRHSCLHLAIVDSGQVEVGSSTGSQSPGSSPLPEAFLPIDSILYNYSQKRPVNAETIYSHSASSRNGYGRSIYNSHLKAAHIMGTSGSFAMRHAYPNTPLHTERSNSQGKDTP